MGAPHDHEHLHAEAPVSLADAALAQLSERGERITAARRAVIGVLAAEHEHRTAEQIAGAVADLGIHRATVYRTLEMLDSLGVVTTRPVGQGSTGYHLATGEDRHAHLHGVCRSCGVVVALPADLLASAARSARNANGFALEPAQSSLVGTCADCARGVS
ncbi:MULTISPECIES: Fur family transcriptional regulator [Microbacterium]|uniref:Fur family transcriptional regulator n=1 Tax=Microbacterium TaxID=33882 RepID=UPI000959EFC4|nr:transcriptional repressor [Microbacterium sp. 67-17]OJV97254.1 MAG: hypothetical protein BGO47_10340 [Microbacterium sp. 67-17]